MRAVHSPAELAEAIEGAQREAAASFGDGTVFLERLLVGPRHIEIQIFGDAHGNVVHLFERECSIQRRHQKIVEEAPSPAVDESLRTKMGAASVALAQAIGYVGAGTVEYLLDANGSFYFLEMNTRLQVEHPVTECITRTDLVAWQIAVANGQSLPLAQEAITREGHAIEVRLYAEDPALNYMPSVGTLHRVAPAGTRGVRWDSGVESGSVVSPHYDPMLAKVISHAPTRAQAAAVLRRELLGTSVHGVTTNAASLAAILGDPAYLAGDTTTAFLDRFPDVMSPLLDQAIADSHLVAVIAARAAGHRTADQRWGFAPSGWRNLPTQGQQIVLSRGDDRTPVSYRIDSEAVELTMDGRTVGASAVRSGEGRWMVTPRDGAGVAVTVNSVVDAHGEQWWANSAQGQSGFIVAPRFSVPSALAAGSGTTAPVPGRIVAVHVAPGDAVAEGQVLVVLEAMKMEHSIRAASASTVAEVRVQVGDQVDARQVLVVLE